MLHKHYLLILLLFILILAFAVRFHLLGEQSLWHDEGNAYVQATRSLPDITTHAARDIHPPGYYWLLALWHTLTGNTEFALRSFSAFASVVSVAFTFVLGRRLVGTGAGIIAALFVALNTFSIYYAQEARMYALLALWSAASMWAFVGLVQVLGKRYGMVGTRHAVSLRKIAEWAILLALFNAAGLYTQYAFPFVMLAQGMLFVLWWGWKILYPSPLFQQRSQDETLQFYAQPPVGTQRAAPLPDTPLPDNPIVSPQENPAGLPSRLSDGAKAIAYYAAANVLALLLFLPWLPTAWAQVTMWPNTGDTIPPVEALPIILGYFAFGITQPGGVTVAVAFFLLFGLLVVTSPAIERRGDPVWSPDGSAHGRSPTKPPAPLFPPWWQMLLPVLWVGVSVGMFLALGLFREANLKFLLPAQIGFALWLARGAWVLWTLQVKHTTAPLLKLTPKFAAALGVMLIVFRLFGGLDPLYNDPAFQRDNYRAIVQTITADARPGDAVILNAPNQQEVFGYYFVGETPVFPLPRGLGGDDTAALTDTRAVIADYDRIFAVFWGTDERDPNNIVENTLDTVAFEAGSTWYGDVRLVWYFSPAEFDSVNESGAVFGDHITLETVALSADTLTPGDVLQVRLEWSAAAPLDARYKVFVQLLAPDGFLVTQHDAEPGGGLFPTTIWTSGETIIDNHALTIPNDLPQAHYTLIVGLYDLNDPQARLRIGDSDHLSLGQIAIDY